MKPRAIFKGSYIRKKILQPWKKNREKTRHTSLFNITIIQP
jgi:hypothetical protein